MFRQYDCHSFRVERLWNLECDATFKRLYKVLLAVYSKYTGKYAMPGQPKFMSLDEFEELINTAGIVDETFGNRDIGPMFNLSMMSQKNELDFDRHFNMTVVEFTEAVSRVANKLIHLPDYFPELPS